MIIPILTSSFTGDTVVRFWVGFCNEGCKDHCPFLDSEVPLNSWHHPYPDLLTHQPRSGKTKATKNSNEAEYRTILDNLISDLLTVLYWPEWPAASLLLSIACRYMVLDLPQSCGKCSDSFHFRRFLPWMMSSPRARQTTMLQRLSPLTILGSSRRVFGQACSRCSKSTRSQVQSPWLRNRWTKYIFFLDTPPFADVGLPLDRIKREHEGAGQAPFDAQRYGIASV